MYCAGQTASTGQARLLLVKSASGGWGKASRNNLTAKFGEENVMLATAERIATSSKKADFRVLAVEDDFDTAEGIEKAFGYWGYPHRVCRTASEAMALAPHFEPEAVVVDIGLPDLDGWDLVVALRHLIHREPVFIAVTACGDWEHFERSRQVGIKHHLVKPNYLGQLNEILSGLSSA